MTWNAGALEESKQAIAALDFSCKDRDASSSAFVLFQRSVLHAASSTAPSEAGLALEALEPKADLLRFLIDYQAERKPYRKRVCELLVILMNIPIVENCFGQERGG